MNKIFYVILIVLPINLYATDRIFIGRYTEGFEWGYLIECGTSEKLWVERGPAALELIEALKEDGIVFSYQMGDKNPTVLVKLKGNLSKEGSWGHLGKYKYQLNILQYISHGTVVESECKK